MIFVQPDYLDVPRYRPEYNEIANTNVVAQYLPITEAMIRSREGSEFLRRKFASIDANSQLESLSSLLPNWDSYGAEAPAQLAIDMARPIVNTLIEQALIPDVITASADGGVAICFVKQNKYADIEFLNSGEVLAVKSNPHGQPVAWSVETNPRATDALISEISTYLSA